MTALKKPLTFMFTSGVVALSFVLAMAERPAMAFDAAACAYLERLRTDVARELESTLNAEERRIEETCAPIAEIYSVLRGEEAAENIGSCFLARCAIGTTTSSCIPKAVMIKRRHHAARETSRLACPR